MIRPQLNVNISGLVLNIGNFLITAPCFCNFSPGPTCQWVNSTRPRGNWGSKRGNNISLMRKLIAVQSVCGKTSEIEFYVIVMFAWGKNISNLTKKLKRGTRLQTIFFQQCPSVMQQGGTFLASLEAKSADYLKIVVFIHAWRPRSRLVALGGSGKHVT